MSHLTELELLLSLQQIETKLKNNEKLTDYEYKIFASMIFLVAVGIAEKSLELVLKIMKGDDKS